MDTPPLPFFAQIEPVGQCNLRCRMCPIQFRPDGRGHGAPAAFMPFATFERLLGQFAGLRELHLQGLGEPLLHPRFFDMVALATERGIEVTTNTNMTLMTPGMAARCVASGLHTICVSIDAATASTFEAIRPRARFDKVLRNLRRLVEAKQAAASSLPAIELVAVLMRRNLDQLPALARLAAAEGASSMRVQQLCHDFSDAALPGRYAPMRNFIDAEMLRPEHLPAAAQVFEETRRQADELGLPLRLPRLAPKPWPPGTAGRERCDWPWRGAYVSYDGKAMPCCMVATPDRIQFGDMAADGVASVWHGSVYQDFRARLDSPVPPDVCAGCSLYRGTF